MTGCVIEQEKALSKAICLALEDGDCAIDLADEFFCIKIPVTVFARFKHNAGLSEV